MATIVALTGAQYPSVYDGNRILPLEGVSLLPAFADDTAVNQWMFFEHEGNAAVIYRQWKLVKRYPGDWELYDIEVDRTETRDVALEHPDVVDELSKQYQGWADRCGVIPREKILAIGKNRSNGEAQKPPTHD